LIKVLLTIHLIYRLSIIIYELIIIYTGEIVDFLGNSNNHNNKKNNNKNNKNNKKVIIKIINNKNNNIKK